MRTVGIAGMYQRFTDLGSRFFPGDLVATALLGLWLLGPSVVALGGSVRAAVGLVAIFVAPGYTFVAMLFPRHSTPNPDSDQSWSSRLQTERIHSRLTSFAERVVLSLGVSVSTVPILGLSLNFTRYGITQASLFGAVGGFVVLCSGIAAVRRWTVAPSDRFSVIRTVSTAREVDWVATRDTRSVVNLQTLLVGSLVLATAGLGVAVWDPMHGQGEQFTEFFVQAEDPETGEFAASGYTAGAAGDDTPRLSVGITNHEGQPMNYTVVAVLQRFSTTDGERVLVSERTLDTVSVPVAPGATGRFDHDVDRQVSGSDNRLAYLLYVGEPPADPTLENSYRDVYVWLGEN